MQSFFVAIESQRNMLAFIKDELAQALSFSTYKMAQWEYCNPQLCFMPQFESLYRVLTRMRKELIVGDVELGEI